MIYKRTFDAIKVIAPGIPVIWYNRVAYMLPGLEEMFPDDEPVTKPENANELETLRYALRWHFREDARQSLANPSYHVTGQQAKVLSNIANIINRIEDVMRYS